MRFIFPSVQAVKPIFWFIVAANAFIAEAEEVFWINWSGCSTTRANTPVSCTGSISTMGRTIDVTYTNNQGIAFSQTGTGTDYFTYPRGKRDTKVSPYTSKEVSNIPPPAEMIGLQRAGKQTLTFSEPVKDLFFAYVSLNGNGYGFDQDFTILPGNSKCGFWGCGSVTKRIHNSEYQLIGSGEPHGTIVFRNSFSSLTWTSLANEHWNGVTIGITNSVAESTEAPTASPTQKPTAPPTRPPTPPESPHLDTPVANAVPNDPKPGCFLLTPRTGGRKGGVWASQPIDITKPFEVKTAIYLGNSDRGADGMAFVLQDHGLNTIGGSNHYKGYIGIPFAFAITVDTYANNNEERGERGDDFVEIQASNVQGIFKPLSKKAFIPNIEDGMEHEFKVTYDGRRMKVFIDGSEKLKFDSNDLTQYVSRRRSKSVYYGYTAATGGASNVQYVCDIMPPPTRPPTPSPTRPPVQINPPTLPPASMPTIGYAKGDPHFKTWSGAKYDFHGVCDLVLLKNAQVGNGISLDIHIRTAKSRMWSFIRTAVVRVGQETFEVMGGKHENRFWKNKMRGDLSDPLTMTVSGYPVTFTQISPKSRQFQIDLGHGTTIVMKTWNAFVSVNIEGHDSEHFGSSLGLMGTFPAGLKIGRDNTTLIDDVNAFGQEWQVNTATDPDLFHDIDGPQHPHKCEIPSASQIRRHLGESDMTKEDAQIACSRVSPEDFDLCVFDVMATNDKDAVGAYVTK